MLKVNSVSPSFKGAWGDLHYVDGKPEIRFYKFLDDSQDEVVREIETKKAQMSKDNLNPVAKDLLTVITEQLNMTKNDFEKFNRGFLTDNLAKLLIKK